MSSAARAPLVLALVVAGLLAGLVAMHHLVVDGAAATGHAAAAAPTPHPAPGGPPVGHDPALLHLCLAVLTAGALVVLAAVLSWWRVAGHSPALAVAVRRARTAPRAPPGPAPARLALLCVLRT